MSNPDFGFRIGIDGEADFKKSIRVINSSMKVLGSEMKLVSAQFDTNDRSQAVFSAHLSVLTLFMMIVMYYMLRR